jgi:hypothetical protein
MNHDKLRHTVIDAMLAIDKTHGVVSEEEKKELTDRLIHFDRRLAAQKDETINGIMQELEKL